MSSRRNIEDIQPLTPQQQGFLLDSLRPSGGGAGHVIMEVSLSGRLDPSRFEASWRATVSRHQALRSTIHWEDLPKPIQVVHKSVDVEVYAGASSELTFEERLALARAEAKKPFALNKAPNLRLRIVSDGVGEHRLLWASHHILIDGWSAAIVLNEVLEHYNSNGNPGSRPTLPSVRQYLAWRAKTDAQAERSTWAELLADVSARGEWWPSGRRELEMSVSNVALAPLEGPLQRFAAAARITVGTAVQAAWAITLARLKGSQDILFGNVVSGRSGDLPNLDGMVGLLANPLPVRLTLAELDTFDDLCARLHAIARRVAPYENTDFGKLREWGILESANAIDSLLAFENFPVAETGQVNQKTGLSLRGFEGGLSTGYPVTGAVMPSPLEVRVQSLTHPSVPDAATIGRLFADVLAWGVTSPKEALAQAPAVPSREAPARGSSDSVPDVVIEKRYPSRPIEVHLAKLWEHVLGVRRIGVNENFFDLGGTSLSAVELFEEVHRQFKRRLPLDALWVTSGTIEDVAALIEADETQTDWPVLVE
ncbi:MAG: condensation domain-containing protein, partial [Pseudomonadota bacterium]